MGTLSEFEDMISVQMIMNSCHRNFRKTVYIDFCRILQFGKAKWIEEEWFSNIRLYYFKFVMPSLHCKYIKYVYNSVAYLGQPQYLKRSCLWHLVNRWKSLTNVTNSSILDVVVVLDMFPWNFHIILCITNTSVGDFYLF